MVKERIPIPREAAAEVLFQHTCCVATNGASTYRYITSTMIPRILGNLAVVCVECHNDTQISGGFGRKLRSEEVRRYRDDWLKRVAERRAKADELAVQKQVGHPPMMSASEERAWRPPSEIALYTFVRSIPEIMKTGYQLAQPEWARGATSVVTQATYQLISVVEQIWIQLAAWYPPGHFGKEPAQYISDFIASRFELRRALIEPNGPGTQGTMIRPMVAYGVLLDIQDSVVLTVRFLPRGSLTEQL